MPAGRPPSHSQGEFVGAAIRLADEFGLASLTLKSLGQSVGASTTAVYRYFADKDEVMAAMRDALLDPLSAAMASAPPEPRDRIMAGALAFRAVVRAHPCLGQLMTQSATEQGSGALVPGMLMRELEHLGLTGELLVRGYQQLESFVVGATVFDFAGAPDHLADRHQRFMHVDQPDLKRYLPDAAAVGRNNDAAFDATLRTLLDALVAEQQAGASRV